MNYGKWLLMTVLALLWSGFCFAQGDVEMAATPLATPLPTPLPELPTADWLMLMVAAIGGMKGMSALAIAASVSQLLLKFLSTPLAKFAGKYKLLAVTGLTLVTGVLALMVASDMSMFVALMHSTTLAAFQVFVHQIWKQFVKKSNELPEVET